MSTRPPPQHTGQGGAAVTLLLAVTPARDATAEAHEREESCSQGHLREKRLRGSLSTPVRGLARRQGSRESTQEDELVTTTQDGSHGICATCSTFLLQPRMTFELEAIMCVATLMVQQLQ